MRESRSALSNEQVETITQAEGRIFETIEEAILAAVREGEIPVIHTKFAARAFIALVQTGNARQPDQSKIFLETEEAAAQILSVFWKGFIGDRPTDL